MKAHIVIMNAAFCRQNNTSVRVSNVDGKNISYITTNIFPSCFSLKSHYIICVVIVVVRNEAFHVLASGPSGDHVPATNTFLAESEIDNGRHANSFQDSIS